MLGEKEKGGEVAAQEQMKEWDKNSPPPLFKEEAQQLRKGERLGQKTLSLPLFNVDKKSMLTGIQGDAPGQTGRCMGMAHHYRTSSMRIRAHPHAGDSPLPQAGPWNDPTTEPLSRGAQRASWVNQTAQVK